MKIAIDNSSLDTKLEASDWRFSAAIVGLIKYFDYHQINYKMEYDYLLYNSKDIDESKYLSFVEYSYDDLHHKWVEKKLSQENLTDEDVKLLNEKLCNKNGSSNSIMQKVFKNIQYDGTNKSEILNILNENREELIRQTYGKRQNGYANYLSVNMKAPVELLKTKQNYCRILGYKCADEGRKSNALGYNFDKNNYVFEDEIEFDFIPFAFAGDGESFFINDNISIDKLKVTNSILSKKISSLSDDDKKDARKILFKSIEESADFIDYDVEVIYKEKNKDYFETLYIRKSAIEIFKQLRKDKFDYNSICFFYKVNDKYYINIQKKITNNILNNLVLDEIIELVLKDREKRDKRVLRNNNYIVDQMIKVNILIRGDIGMKDRLKGAYACAKQVIKVLPDNKISSYRQKLISAIIFKDYDKANQILLQLSNYSGIEFGFVYDLFENFEENKDLVYTFINALSKEGKKEENNIGV